jgi:hypothetical protein
MLEAPEEERVAVVAGAVHGEAAGVTRREREADAGQAARDLEVCALIVSVRMCAVKKVGVQLCQSGPYGVLGVLAVGAEPEWARAACAESSAIDRTPTANMAADEGQAGGRASGGRS